jgi:hypothetical protein
VIAVFEKYSSEEMARIAGADAEVIEKTYRKWSYLCCKIIFNFFDIVSERVAACGTL